MSEQNHNYIRIAEMHYEALAKRLIAAGYCVFVIDTNKYDIAVGARARESRSVAAERERRERVKAEI